MKAKTDKMRITENLCEHYEPATRNTFAWCLLKNEYAHCHNCEYWKNMNKKTVFIDEFGWIVPQEQSTHKATLSGGYSWSFSLGAWWYDIEKIEPKIPLSRILSSEMLLK